MSDYANTGAASTLPNRSVRARTEAAVVEIHGAVMYNDVKKA